VQIDPAQIEEWLQAEEVEHLEFKAARDSFENDNLCRYCAALANNGGGLLVLGITNERPREVCGTKAFQNLNKTKLLLLERLRLDVGVTEVDFSGKRVLVFQVGRHPVGLPVSYNGRYQTRVGESLVNMTPERLAAITREATPDFSATICPGATLDALDNMLIQHFRARWRTKSGNTALDNLSDRQLLADAQLIIDDGITYAAIVMLGTSAAVARHCARAETIYEYRGAAQAIPAQQRQEFKRGFLAYLEDLWSLVNQRNETHQLRQGLFVLDFPDLNEGVVREVLLNALAHRDYQDPGSVWIRQYPRRLEVVSPGGFPPGITPQNMMYRQQPRNRAIAEALQKCGLVERANQGAKLMFRHSILEGKGFPDFTGTDDYQVAVTLKGDAADSRFVAYLNRIGRQRLESFDLNDLIALELVHRQKPVPDQLQTSLVKLKEAGVIESPRKGKRGKLMLTQAFYGAIGDRAAYTRRVGLGEDEKQALLLKHLRSCGDEGAPIGELEDVVTDVPRTTLYRMLGKLREAGLITIRGERRWARWVAERKTRSK
jgi:ATP-dependent DNA helicase RecG